MTCWIAAALEVQTFAVLGSSGGAPDALACGMRLPERVPVVGIVGGVAPPDAPGALAALSPPLRLMFRLSRAAPAVLRCTRIRNESPDDAA